jgi:acetyl-CoA synthetase
VDAAGKQESLTFADLRDRSAQFAGVLRDLGVRTNDRVATLLPRTPELLIAMLAIWRIGAVHVPLFTAFGPDAIAYRLDHSGARVLVTDTANQHKLGSPGESTMSVIVVEKEGEGQLERPSSISFWRSLDRAAPVTSPVTISGDDLMFIIYTSGTTGLPKGVPFTVKALAAFEAYMRFGLDVRADDVFWNIADPGWAYGLAFAVVGPLLIGQSTLLVNAPFNAEMVYQIWQTHGVTNFAAAPTVYRALRAAGVPKGAQEWLRLRVASSAGEPLNPEVITWAATELDVPLHDHYGQTEHGMLVNNHHHVALRQPLHPGSMGQAMPGFRMAIVDDAGAELGPSQEGQIAIDTTRSPLYWFPGYFLEPERTARCFTSDGRYYLTGDAATRDADGYISFASRNDDLIKSSGYRIGPFEVESALMAHSAVAEAAVIGEPDVQRGEIVKAFVVLRSGVTPSDVLADELRQRVRTHLGAHAYPREIVFAEQLPKTPSGKVQRFLLRVASTTGRR